MERFKFTIEHTNYKGKKTTKVFVARNVQELSLMCFNVYGSSYTSCKLVSTEKCQDTKNL